MRMSLRAQKPAKKDPDYEYDVDVDSSDTAWQSDGRDSDISDDIIEELQETSSDEPFVAMKKCTQCCILLPIRH